MKKIKTWQTQSIKHRVSTVLIMDGVSFKYTEKDGIVFSASAEYVERFIYRLVKQRTEVGAGVACPLKKERRKPMSASRVTYGNYTQPYLLTGYGGVVTTDCRSMLYSPPKFRYKFYR